MAYDPLTEQQKREFLERFCERFFENYEKALQSGAVDTESLQDRGYILAGCVLQITAEQFAPPPSIREAQEILKNLRYFI